MKIVLEGEPKEIAALVLAVQGRQGSLSDIEKEAKKVLEKLSQKKPDRAFQ